jgi:peptidoglycan/LPS O-acetylase OafA/YrhL
VLLIVLLFPLRTKALLSNRVMARLGVLSYSIYVLHQPLFHYTLQAWRLLFPHTEVGWNALTASWFALTTLTCVMSAGLTYRLIERPFLVRKARLDVDAPAAHARAA